MTNVSSHNRLHLSETGCMECHPEVGDYNALKCPEILWGYIIFLIRTFERLLEHVLVVESSF